MREPVTLGDLAHRHESMTGARHFATYVRALARAKGAPDAALAALTGRASSYPAAVQRDFAALVEKTAVSAVSSGNSAALAADPTNLEKMFLDFVRPSTVIGKLSMARRVPANMPIIAGVTGTVAGWRVPGQAIRVTRGTFARTTIPLLSVAAISICTEEVAKSDDERALALLTRDLAAAVRAASDASFLAYDSAGTAGLEPAGIANGTLELQNDGSLQDDMIQLLEAVGGSDWSNLVLVTSPRCALFLAMSFGIDTLGVNGGTWYGVPVIVSAASPVEEVTAGTLESITALNADDVLLTEGDSVDVQVSRDASIKMDDAPGMHSVTPVETSTISLFQANAVAIRAERALNWQLRTEGIGAAVLTGIAVT